MLNTGNITNKKYSENITSCGRKILARACGVGEKNGHQHNVGLQLYENCKRQYIWRKQNDGKTQSHLNDTLHQVHEIGQKGGQSKANIEAGKRGLVSTHQ